MAQNRLDKQPITMCAWMAERSKAPHSIQNFCLLFVVLFNLISGSPLNQVRVKRQDDFGEDESGAHSEHGHEEEHGHGHEEGHGHGHQEGNEEESHGPRPSNHNEFNIKQEAGGDAIVSITNTNN
uniref:Uncharacterized protein n=1 Tax=Ditylenchus dipsaci TaxID=166011 RepID=A0A915CZW2_9BILA